MNWLVTILVSTYFKRKSPQRFYFSGTIGKIGLCWWFMFFISQCNVIFLVEALAWGGIIPKGSCHTVCYHTICNKCIRFTVLDFENDVYFLFLCVPDKREPPVPQTDDGFLNFTSVHRNHTGW